MMYIPIRLVQCKKLRTFLLDAKPPIFQAIANETQSNIADKIMSTTLIPTILKPVINVYNVPKLSPPT